MGSGFLAIQIWSMVKSSWKDLDWDVVKDDVVMHKNCVIGIQYVLIFWNLLTGSLVFRRKPFPLRSIKHVLNIPLTGTLEWDVSQIYVTSVKNYTTDIEDEELKKI